MSAVTVPNARIEGLTERGELLVVLPTAFLPAAKTMIESCKKYHNGYGKLSIDRPFKPRTFGPRKVKPDDPGYQSNHLHGHLQQLAIHFGYTLLEMKEIMKADVPEWPTTTRKVGLRFRQRPVSEADVSTAVEARAIEWCHMIAGEEGLVLKEGKEAEGEK